MVPQKANTIDHINAIRESKTKTASLITFGVSLLIAILLVVLALRPTILTITKINKEIKQKETVSNQLKNKIEALSNLDKEYKDSKEKFDSLQFVFPENKGFALLLSNIEPIVSRNGFELTSISFNSYDGETYKLAPKVLAPSAMRVTVRGDNSNLLSLLKDLEGMPNYPVLEVVSFTDRKDDQGLGVFTIVLRIYDVNRGNFYE
ncbi:MAG TPA: type 4a pilus biogenesis protein PilO [Candidatus Dojkabacteria bacterium]|nr:type 4a pilus biogenesis protein PilO [Candidatus Dojkabacteria bacterium]